MARFNWIFFLSTATLSLLPLLTGCNLYDAVDSPTGDTQLLSAARACFDNGDFDCARENYGKLSSAYADVAKEEEAFITLDEQGASMGSFMEFVGNVSDKGTGYAFTRLAEKMVPNKGVNQRVAIWNAYNPTVAISDPNLKNFVSFIGSAALAAAILADTADTTGMVTGSGFSVSPTACKSGGVCNANCALPGGANISNSATGALSSTNPPNTSPASLDQLYYAIKGAVDALSALDASGKLGSAATSLNAILTVLGGTSPSGGTNQCFVQSLFTQGVGTSP